jgi:hypothetical protein
MMNEQEIKKIIQNHTKKCMNIASDRANEYDISEEANLYNLISDEYCYDLEDQHQKYIYPSIIRHYSSKELSAISKKYGTNHRRSLYDTIKSAIMLEAKQLLMQNIRLRNNQQPSNAFEQPPNA